MERLSMIHKGIYRQAFFEHRYLLVLGIVYSIVVSAAALYYGMDPREFLSIVIGIVFSVVITGVFLMFAYFYALAREYTINRKGAVKRHEIACDKYTDSGLFAAGWVAVIFTCAINFFFLAKSLVNIVHPFDLDPLFAKWDRVLHFGRYPHEYLMTPLLDATPLANVLDIVYASWFPVMYLVLGYNFFFDRNPQRRMLFLWVYMLAWILLGSAFAILLSSCGPVFFHEYYPALPDIYQGFREHFALMAEEGKLIFFPKTVAFLREWTNNDTLADPNSIAAMPSLHIGITWLYVLYARSFGRTWFAAAIAFCLLTFLATVYSGLHYAVDSYFSIVFISLVWWIVGKIRTVAHAG